MAQFLTELWTPGLWPKKIIDGFFSILKLFSHQNKEALVQTNVLILQFSLPVIHNGRILSAS